MMTIVMPPVASVAPEADLGARIRAAHEAAQAGARRALEDAVRCGELLLEAKRVVGHGRWLPWLAENTGIGPRQAQNYMRVARHRDVVLASNASSATHLSAAVALLAGPRADRQPHAAWSGEVEWYTPATYVEAARALQLPTSFLVGSMPCRLPSRRRPSALSRLEAVHSE